MFGDVTRVGANYHAQEAWGNLKKVNGDYPNGGNIHLKLKKDNRSCHHQNTPAFSFSMGGLSIS